MPVPTLRITMAPATSRRNDNPYLQILSDALAAAGVEARAPTPWGQPRVFHIHWLEQIFWGRLSSRSTLAARFNMASVLRQARAARRQGGRVVWTVHNLAPHEGVPPASRSAWDAFLARFLPLVTDIVSMSETTIPAIRTHFPAAHAAQIHYVPHPHYADYFGRVEPEAVARSASPTILAIGKIRRYKQIRELVTAYKAMAQPDWTLRIVGEADADYAAEITAEIGDAPGIHFRNAAVSDAELLGELRAASVAVFNFRDILNSGSVLAALSAGTPVIAPSKGVLRETAAIVGADWMRLHEGTLDPAWLAQTVTELARDRAGTMPDLSPLSPAAIGLAHRAIYEA